jgi:membrane fusion protein (multidrug efflux system)
MRWTGTYVAAALLAVAAAGCSSDPAPERAAAAPAKPAAAAAPSGAVSGGRAAEVREIPAVLAVEHEVDVLAEHDGPVVEVVADEGAKVAAGSLLARLDNRQLESQLEQARADQRISEYNVKYNEAELHANQALLERAQLMYKEGLGSKADLDAAEFKAKGSAYDLESWKANVEKRRAEVRTLELEVDKMRVRAPFSGVVSRRYVRQGDLVAKGARCFRISQLSPLLVEFQVPETDSRKPAVDQTVRGTLMSDPGRSFEARITRVSPVVDAASGSYEVTAKLQAPAPELKPGMAVRIAWSNSTAPRP